MGSDKLDSCETLESELEDEGQKDFTIGWGERAFYGGHGWVKVWYF